MSDAQCSDTEFCNVHACGSCCGPGETVCITSCCFPCEPRNPAVAKYVGRYQLSLSGELVAGGVLEVDPAGGISGSLFGTARCSNLYGRVNGTGELSVKVSNSMCSAGLTGKIADGSATGLVAGWAKSGVHAPKTWFRAEFTSSDVAETPDLSKNRVPAP